MTKAWPMVKLGDILSRTGKPIDADPSLEYSEITVRLWGKGVVERGRVSGGQVNGKRFVARAGNFIASRIDARNGAMGLVPKSLDGGLVTNDFPLFQPNHERLDLSYLSWLSKTASFVELCLRASEGTTNRVRLKEERFLALEIPLPSLAEQRRVVASIEKLAAQIHEAQRLRKAAADEAEAMIFRVTSSLIDNPNWETSIVGKVLIGKPRNGLGPQKEVESGGRPMLRINAVSSTPSRFVDMSASKQVEVSDAVASPFVVQHNDVFIVRYNGDINRVAKPAIYKGNNEAQVVYPDKLIRLRTNSDLITPDFLVVALSSLSVRRQIEELGKTTAGNIGVSGANVQSFEIHLPPLLEQRRIVAELDALQAEVDALKRLQAATALELDALLPSILDRAFKGEF
ncbi:MAG: restriction endonuclease subunit S [Verrucomicrobiota bacterium]